MSEGRNGVNIGEVMKFVEAVKKNNDLAKIKFIARSRWGGGTRADISVKEFHVDGKPGSRPDRDFTIATDEPKELGGTDAAANPVELLAAGLCGCLTAGIATNTALFETDLESLEVSVEFDWDLLGILGLDRGVQNHAQGLHYTVKLKGKEGVTEEQLRKAKETLDRKSAVLNTLINAVPATTDFIIET